jgi:magnesium transporter
MNPKKRTRKKPGLPPGSLIYTRDKVQEHVSLQFFQYNEDSFGYSEPQNIKEVFDKFDSKKVNWININGLHKTSIIQDVGDRLQIHPLILEDILHTDHMPKIEDYDKYLFLTLKMMSYNDVKNQIKQEHISMILGDHYLVTFQESDGDVFEPVREAIKSGKGRLRKRGADYLFYRLIDIVVDHYYLIADKTEENLELIEEILLRNQADNVSENILFEKKNMITLRRCIIPLREEIRGLKQKESALIQDSTYNFIDDVFDHLMHLSQTLDGFRDLTASLMELQIAVNSNRMNDIMKTLTIYAAIFMPLTFIAGIYGMNFHLMPELEWNWGYPAVLAVMAMVAGAMLVFMKQRKWM